MKKSFDYIQKNLIDTHGRGNDTDGITQYVISWSKANAAVIMENEECIKLCTEAHKSVCPYRSFFSSNHGECLKKKIPCDGKCDYMEDFIYNVNSKNHERY